MGWVEEIGVKRVILARELSLNEINNSEKPFGKDKQYVINILEKQIAYVVQYYPQLEDAYNNCENMTLDLNDVYSIMSKTSYYFQKAGIEVVIPPEFDNIIIPRASINAKIKELDINKKVKLATRLAELKKEV